MDWFKELIEILLGRQFRTLDDIFDMKQVNQEKIDAHISKVVKKASSLVEVCKEMNKVANNEEELKFIWFRIGQIEMGNMIIKHLRKVLGTVLDDIKEIITTRTGIK